MVQGIKFLTKKSFNPTNISNQKVVWEREQQQQHRQQQIQERNRILQQEKDHETIQLSRGGATKVNFLYEPPPGLTIKTTSTASSSSTTTDLQQQPQNHHGDSVLLSTERQPGDDDAAAAFRQLLFAATNKGSDDSKLYVESTDNTTAITMQHSSRGTVLQGTNYDPVAAATDPTTGAATSAGTSMNTRTFQLTPLEKAAGKKPQHGTRNSLSYEEQVQRFPMLANAPRVPGIIAAPPNPNESSGHDSSNKSKTEHATTSITFKPFGAQIRQVRCLSCGIWGHSKGDRECTISGWDPFAVSTTTATTTTTTTATQRSTIVSQNQQDGPQTEALHHNDNIDATYPRRTDGDMDRNKSKKRRHHESSEDDSDDSTKERRRHSKSHKKKKDKKKKKKHRKEQKPLKQYRRNHNADEDDGYSSFSSTSMRSDRSDDGRHRYRHDNNSKKRHRDYR